MKAITQSLLFSLLLIFAFSCSSDDSGNSNPQTSDDPDIAESDFFIKAKVNGEERIFNRENFISAQMSSFSLNGFYILGIEGSAFDNSGQEINETIAIGLNSENPIAVGIYDQPELLPLGLKHALIGYSNTELNDETAFVTDINDPVSSLEITELTQNTIKGKFSGIVQNPIVENDIVITDGEFFLELFIGDE